MVILVSLFPLAVLFCIVGGGYILFPPGVFLISLGLSFIFLAPPLATFAGNVLPWGNLNQTDETWLTTIRILGVCLFVWGVAEQIRGEP